MDFASAAFCTGGAPGKDSCFGDSGGPAIFEGLRRAAAAGGGAAPASVGILTRGSEHPENTADCGVEGRSRPGLARPGLARHILTPLPRPPAAAASRCC